METRIVLIVLLIIVLVILARCIRVVQQSKAYVIERLGAFHTVWSVGLHFKIPFIDRVHRTGGGLPTPACHYQGQRHHPDRHGPLLPNHGPQALRLWGGKPHERH